MFFGGALSARVDGTGTGSNYRFYESLRLDAVQQFELAARYKGERVAVLEARRHYCWYLKGVPHSNYYKEQIVQMNTLEDVYRVTKGIKRDLT